MASVLAKLPATETTDAGSFAEGLVLMDVGAWDLVLCAHDLPDGNGSRLLERAAAQAPRARRVLVLEDATPLDAGSASAKGAPHLVLRMPGDLERGRAQLARLLE